MLRKIIVLGACSWALAVVVACSSDDDSTTSGTSSSFKNCSTNTTGSGSGSCTQAELETYSNCVLDKCDATYKECYGSGYKSGSFSGPCGSYISCTQKCDCNDTSCAQKCTIDTACTDCSKKFLGCTQGCTLPACATSGINIDAGGLGGGKTCADLEACCNKITDTAAKDQCNQTKASASGVDLICGLAYSGFEAKCP